MLEGANGPPTRPEELRFPAVTVMAGSPVTLRLTDRVVFPAPLELLVKLTVSV